MEIGTGCSFPWDLPREESCQFPLGQLENAAPVYFAHHGLWPISKSNTAESALARLQRQGAERCIKGVVKKAQEAVSCGSAAYAGISNNPPHKRSVNNSSASEKWSV